MAEDRQGLVDALQRHHGGQSQGARVSQRLLKVAVELSDLARDLTLTTDNVAESTSALEAATKAYSYRRKRDTIMPADLFADPAWDMLLNLFIAAETGEQVSVSSLCIASAVPHTTALRWMVVLEEHDLIVRREDPEDERRIFVDLSVDARTRMLALFSGMAVS